MNKLKYLQDVCSFQKAEVSSMIVREKMLPYDKYTFPTPIDKILTDLEIIICIKKLDASTIAIFDKKSNVIQLNSKFESMRTMFPFTMAHVLGRIILHDVQNIEIPFSENKLETDPHAKEANVFAAHLLVPLQALSDAYRHHHLSIDEMMKYFNATKALIDWHSRLIKNE